MHALTNKAQWELRIDYTFTNGTKGYLSYSNFRVGLATEQYPLTILGFDGVTTDPFSTHSLTGMKFTTRDRDGDLCVSCSCAITGHPGGNSGGWWYRSCSHFAPNHRYNHAFGIWLNYQWFQLPFVEIKIRPKVCTV